VVVSRWENALDYQRLHAALDGQAVPDAAAAGLPAGAATAQPAA